MRNDTTICSRGSLGRPRVIVVAVLATCSCALLPGCQKQLFPEKSPRSQFETYDTLRLQNQPLEIPDEFGNPQPALRARLTPQN